MGSRAAVCAPRLLLRVRMLTMLSVRGPSQTNLLLILTGGDLNTPSRRRRGHSRLPSSLPTIIAACQVQSSKACGDNEDHRSCVHAPRRVPDGQRLQLTGLDVRARRGRRADVPSRRAVGVVGRTLSIGGMADKACRFPSHSTTCVIVHWLVALLLPVTRAECEPWCTESCQDLNGNVRQRTHHSGPRL